MTEAECERLVVVAERDGLTLSEWCREALLQQAGVQKPRALEETVLAEIIALRTILLNAHYKLAHGEALMRLGILGVLRKSLEQASAGTTADIRQVVAASPRDHALRPD